MNSNELELLLGTRPPNQDNSYEDGIRQLLMFIQNTFTGPKLDLPNKEYVCLSIDEEAYELLQYPELLFNANVILVEQINKTEYKSKYWWAARTLFIHQRVLENHSFILFEKIQDYYSQCEDLMSLDAQAKSRLNLEIGIFYQFYGKDTEALAELSRGFAWKLTGVMGKRTKFQSTATSQLVINAQSSTHTNDDIPRDVINPTALELNDDVLLDKIDFSEPQADLTHNISPVDQAILLAFCLNVKNINANDGLTIEEMLPFVNRVLANPNNWMITTMALLIRSRLEGNKSRTVERSCLQLQTLVDQWEFRESDALPKERLTYFFLLLVPPRWEIEKELALRFVSIGVVRSALEIFERLKMWENVISCHQMLEQPAKAEIILKSLLQKAPDSPKLLCLLGDVSGDIDFYENAWKISGDRYSRAMRSLGAHYFRKNLFLKSIECYSKALTINPMFDNSWFIMGCAALKLDDYPVALKSFAKVTKLDPDNSEAWNNLASVYIKQKKLKEAFKCLKEAIRVNFEATQVWENFLYVAVDIREFSEAIRAIEKIFTSRIDKQEWRDKVLDEAVLQILILAIIKNIPDANNQGSVLHAPKMKKLLVDICLKYSSANFYRICGDFYQSLGDFRAWLEFHSKSYRKALNQSDILECAIAFEELSHATLQLVDTYKACSLIRQDIGGKGEKIIICADWLYHSKMVLKTVIKRTQVIDFDKLVYSDNKNHRVLVAKLSEMSIDSS